MDYRNAQQDYAQLGMGAGELSLYRNGSNVWYQPGALAGNCGTLTVTGISAMAYAGNRYLVVCNGQVHELPAAATLEAAQEKAEQLAHQHQSEAFILKPVRKVAPKRDVVTVDL